MVEFGGDDAAFLGMVMVDCGEFGFDVKGFNF